MKIFLIGYLNKNLGDDLFYDIILKRYPNVMFYTFSDTLYLNYPNLKIIKLSFVKKWINKFLKLITLKRVDLYTIYGNRCDCVITIGGSMFIESKYSYRINYYNRFNVPYFIIGANVGPFKTDNYLSFLRKNVFEKAVDVSLRDINSYKLFSDMKNLRYNPDIVFSYDVKDDNNVVNQKKVIISIIDINTKLSQVQCNSIDLYEMLIIKISNYFKKNNYLIEFFSFCDNEGDLCAIERIKSKLDYDIIQYSYDGNINEAIKELSTSTTIVGTRFHANIIGFLLKKNVIPIVYNNKTRNMLKDLEFEGAYFDLKELKEQNIDEYLNENIEYKIDVSMKINSSMKHFEKIDEFIGDGNNGKR